jgi:hypothetical protein
LLAGVSSAEVVLFLGMVALAMYSRHIIMYTAGFIGVLFWGFYVAGEVDFMTGLAIAIIAIYMLFGAVRWFWQRTV